MKNTILILVATLFTFNALSQGFDNRILITTPDFIFEIGECIDGPQKGEYYFGSQMGEYNGEKMFIPIKGELIYDNNMEQIHAFWNDSILGMIEEEFKKALDHYAEFPYRESVWVDGKSFQKEWDLFTFPEGMSGKLPACALAFYTNVTEGEFLFIGSEENTEAREFGSTDPFRFSEEIFFIELEGQGWEIKVECTDWNKSQITLFKYLNFFKEDLISAVEQRQLSSK